MLHAESIIDSGYFWMNVDIHSKSAGHILWSEVRDLLLGKEPDDLDLTLCLRDCPEEASCIFDP